MKKFSNHVYFKISKKNDGTQKERKMIARNYPSWTESLLETESEIYVMNQVMLDVEQSAFGTKNVSSYLKKRNAPRNYYFGITNANLYNDDDLIQVNYGV